MKNLYLICISAILLFISACSKKNSFDISSVDNGSYLPLTTGSIWTYIKLEGNKQTDEETVTVNGETAIIEGKTYYKQSGKSKISGTYSSYSCVKNHIYYSCGTPTSAEIVYLNDTLAVDETWVTKLDNIEKIDGVSGRNKGTIVEKGITKIVNGKTFNNVIHVKFERQYDYNGTNDYQTDYQNDEYYAKGIGVIESDIKLYNDSISRTLLTSYLIK